MKAVLRFDYPKRTEVVARFFLFELQTSEFQIMDLSSVGNGEVMDVYKVLKRGGMSRSKTSRGTIDA